MCTASPSEQEQAESSGYGISRIRFIPCLPQLSCKECRELS